MKKEIFLKNILPMVLILIMGGVFIISSKVFYRENVIDLISNDLYQKNVTHCIQTGHVQLSELIAASNDTFISKKLSEHTRGIYFSSDYSYSIPVVEGRFFTYSDFKENHNYVVIGQNLKSNLYTKQNKLYYDYLGTEYEVIGIVGFDIQSELDDVIFFNLVNIFEQTPQNTEIVMGETLDQVNQNLQLLQLEDSISTLDIPNVGISRIWSVPNIYLFLICVTYFSCVVALLFVIYLKSYYYSNFVKVFKLLGFQDSFLYRKVTIIESFLYFLAFYLGAVIAHSLFMRDFYFEQEFLYRMLLYSVINCVIIIVFNFFVLKEKIRKFIKGGESYGLL